MRLQWDPDHDPHGERVARRAVQIGLRGPKLRDYASPPVLREVLDITEQVHAQKARLDAEGPDALETPKETVMPLEPPDLARWVGVDEPD